MDWLLGYIVREIVPRVAVRFVTVDAYYTESGPDGKPWDSSTFCLDKFDFRYIDPNETLPPKGGYRSMYLDLLPLTEALEK